MTKNELLDMIASLQLECLSESSILENINITHTSPSEIDISLKLQTKGETTK